MKRQRTRGKRELPKAVEPPAGWKEVTPETFTSVTGGKDRLLGVLLLHGGAKVIRATSGAQDIPPEVLVDMASRLLGSVEPRNPLEGLLAAQMAATHVMGIEFSQRALRADSLQLLAVYGNIADRLMKTFTHQVEALGRLRGQSTRQTVRVEHVHVESGGQAVVGAVQPPAVREKEGG